MEKADLLGRNDFIEMLEQIVLNKVDKLEGLSLAIDGKWGCGKSFIIRELEKKLIGQGCLVVHYNCWQNDYYDEPLVAILSVLVDSLNELQTPEAAKAEKTNVTKDAIILFFKRIAFMILKNKFGVDVEELGFNIDELKDSVQEVLGKDKADLICKDFDKNLSLKKTIGIVCEFLLKLKEEYRGIVFVVDELDRCLPEYSIKVLERLHHICYDTANDTFQFAQVIAINRDELCDGISKAYGRGVLKGTGTDEKIYTKSGSNSFGNYYLQKFIQMIVPVPPGKSIQTALPILDGFEKYFDTRYDLQMHLLHDLFETVFSKVPIRIREQMVEYTRVAHQITLETGVSTGIDRIKPSLNVLCVELLDCFCRSIMMSSLPEIKMEYEREQNVIGHPSYKVRDIGMCSLKINCNAQFVNNTNSLEKGIFEIFKTGYRVFVEKENKLLQEMGFNLPKFLGELKVGNQEEKKYVFDMDNPKAEVLWYYLSKDDKLEPSNQQKPSNDDVRFVKAFRQTLNILT